MKKFVAFSFGALMALSFNACSDDDVAGNTTDIQTNENSMYLSVNITESETGTRADGDDTPVYKNGQGIEHNVNSIRFYFFSDKGNFVSAGNVYKEASWKDNEDGSNVESFGQSIVIVPGDDTEDPTMMVTVINPPQGFEVAKGETIDKFFKGLVNYNGTGDSGFVMTTSSFYEDATNPETYYYVTKVSKEKFHKTYAEAQADDDPLDVYVERLACKVTLTLDKNLKRLKTDSEGNYIYKLGKFAVNGDTENKVTFYAKFLSWSLNATAPKSYYMKHLLSTWTNSDLGFNWNHPANFRSYWSEAYTYDNGFTYADYYKTALDTDPNAFHYVSADSMLDVPCGFDGNSANYCNENTNSAAVINTYHIPGLATHVLLLAQLVDKDGNELKVNGEEIVKFNGKYYTRTGIVDRVIAATAAKNYTATIDGASVPLSSAYVTLVNDDFLNGHIKPQLTDEGKAIQWYNGTDAVSADDINTLFADYVDNNEGYEIIGYHKGYMYYYAIIQHLNQTTPKLVNGAYEYAEGYYGVVRNHWYDVTINGFGHKPFYPKDPTDPNYDPKEDPNSNEYDENYDPTNPDDFGDDDDDPENVDPGHGVEDPDEPIVPNPDTDNDYYLGATIHILAWRLVQQNLQL
jgi:hypothetical protein